MHQLGTYVAVSWVWAGTSLYSLVLHLSRSATARCIVLACSHGRMVRPLTPFAVTPTPHMCRATAAPAPAAPPLSPSSPTGAEGSTSWSSQPRPSPCPPALWPSLGRKAAQRRRRLRCLPHPRQQPKAWRWRCRAAGRGRGWRSGRVQGKGGRCSRLRCRPVLRLFRAARILRQAGEQRRCLMLRRRSSCHPRQHPRRQRRRRQLDLQRRRRAALQRRIRSRHPRQGKRTRQWLQQRSRSLRRQTGQSGQVPEHLRPTNHLRP